MAAWVLADMVAETTTTTGTGALTLAGAYLPGGANVGYRTVSAGVGSTNSSYFKADDGAGNWEVFKGTLTGSSLSRDTVLSSSNSNAAVSFGAGVKVVIAVIAAEGVPAFDVPGQFNKPQRPSMSAETAPVSNVLTWDLTTNQLMRVNFNASITTLTLTGTLSALAGTPYTIALRMNGGSAVTWGSSFIFPGGSAPALTGTSGKLDLFSFLPLSNDGGTTYKMVCQGYSLGN